MMTPKQKRLADVDFGFRFLFLHIFHRLILNLITSFQWNFEFYIVNKLKYTEQSNKTGFFQVKLNLTCKINCVSYFHFVFLKNSIKTNKIHNLSFPFSRKNKQTKKVLKSQKNLLMFFFFSLQIFNSLSRLLRLFLLIHFFVALE